MKNLLLWLISCRCCVLLKTTVTTTTTEKQRHNKKDGVKVPCLKGKNLRVLKGLKRCYRKLAEVVQGAR